MHLLDTLTTRIKAPKKEVISVFLDHIPFRHSRIIRLLLSAKGLKFPKSSKNIENNNNFILLEYDSHSITFGVAGRFWSYKPDWQRLTRREFHSFSDPDYAKIFWKYSFEETARNETLIRWDTYVVYLSNRSKVKFHTYWEKMAFISRMVRTFLLFLMKTEINLLLRKNKLK